MDQQNEMIQQLANNPQAMAQLAQIMQQNGMIPPANQPQPMRQPMPWNVPTNPMAAMWLNNMFGGMNAINNTVANGNGQKMAQNQPQQAQGQMQQPAKDGEGKVLPVRVVKSPDDIKVYQVPMSDDISLFLQDDLKVIYGKKWTSDGGIKNMRFVRMDEDITIDASNNATANNPGFDVQELMANIAALIDSKLEQFKKDYQLDGKGQAVAQSKANRNAKKAGELEIE